MEWRTVFWHMLQWAFVGGLSEDGVHEILSRRVF